MKSNSEIEFGAQCLWDNNSGRKGRKLHWTWEKLSFYGDLDNLSLFSREAMQLKRPIRDMAHGVEKLSPYIVSSTVGCEYLQKSPAVRWPLRRLTAEDWPLRAFCYYCNKLLLKGNLEGVCPCPESTPCSHLGLTLHMLLWNTFSSISVGLSFWGKLSREV